MTSKTSPKSEPDNSQVEDKPAEQKKPPQRGKKFTGRGVEKRGGVK